MRHLLGIAGLDRPTIEGLLARSEVHLRSLQTGEGPKPFVWRWIATVFFEDSTRTRLSFEAAAASLGANVVTWSARGSSTSKGETLLDTVRNIDAMGPAAMVIRHGSSGAPHLAAAHVRGAVINGGDGTNEHPSQALLDAFTLQKALGSLGGKRIAIVGDVAHSRVARSNILCLSAMGAEVIVCGPPTLIPPCIESLGAKVSYDLDAIVAEVDAVMMLRLQLERQSESFIPSVREFGRLFGLNTARADRMRAHAVVLHPGPLNRGVEIGSDVADGARSRILDQVRHGVAVRRAILEACG